MYNTRNGDFMNLQIDYISDLHLDFYIKNSNDIEEFISKNIKPKVNGELLILAGDTMWYKPNILDYLIQTDMFFVKSKINIYHKDSMNFYNKLNNVDIMVSHVPPIKNVNNTCYFNSVKDYKGRIWIYGHDHIPNEIVINKTLFLSNPWGYENKEFPVKSLTIKK